MPKQGTTGNVARSLSVDKPRVASPNLVMALFLDISGDPNLKAPTQPERRERLLQEIVRKARKPVVLFIDEAHDIHGHTLNGLKRLMELIAAGGGKLSVVLVGHPRLQNDLRRATMEEIGVIARFVRRSTVRPKSNLIAIASRVCKSMIVQHKSFPPLVPVRCRSRAILMG